MTSGPRIVLVRHGRTAHRAAGGPLDREGVLAHRRAEDAAGIDPASRPPDRLVALAASADRIVASDLPRALQSAELLARGSIEATPLLRESPLAVPATGAQLPLPAWQLLIHAGWEWRLFRGASVAPPADRERAARAAEWLEGIAGDSGLVVAVTHGVFRTLLIGAFLARRWRLVQGGWSHANWSAWTVARERPR